MPSPQSFDARLMTVRRRKSKSTALRSARRKMFFETLEERKVLATITAGAGPGGFETINSATSLALWLDASDIDGDNAPDALADNSAITTWVDKSGFARNFTSTNTVSYTLASAAGNNQPATRYSNSRLQSAYNFDALDANYSIFGVSRYTGGDNERVISSTTRNWLFGHHASGDQRWYAEGWIQNSGSATTAFHVYSGIIGPAVPNADFWKNGTQLNDNSTGYNGTNYKPGRIELGSYNNGANETSNAEVAELVIINRNVNEAERRLIENALSAKYNIAQAAAQDVYTGDNATIVGGFAGNYDLQVLGIGRVNSANQVLSAGQGGFGIEASAIGDDGDFVTAGHKTISNSFTTAGIPAGVTRRFERSWYVDVADANNNLGATLAFDYSDAGLAVGAANAFRLLRSIDGGTTWTDVGATAISSGDQFKFNLTAAELSTGLYTLGDSSAPLLMATATPLQYTIGAAPTQIDAGFTVMTTADPTITGATVSIAGFVNGNADVLALPAPVGGIVAAYNNATGTLTLSGIGTAAEYQTALRSVTFSKAAYENTPQRTLVYGATDGTGQTGSTSRTVTIGANGPTDVTWDGGGDGVTWNIAANWVGDIAPDANDIAVFADIDVGAVNITSPEIVAGIRFTNTSGGFTLSGSPLSLVGAAAIADSSSASTNTIDANVSITQNGTFSKTGTGTLTVNGVLAGTFAGNLSGGTANFTNLTTALTAATTFNVQATATLRSTTLGSGNGIGAATVDLNGGALEFAPGATVTSNSLIERWYPNVYADTNLIIDAVAANNTDTYLALTPDSTTSLSTALGNFTTAQLVARSPSALGAFGNRFGATWTGHVTVGGASLPAGNVSFGTSSDDGSAIYVDSNSNGTFESTELVVDNRGGHGNQSRIGTVNLAAGTYGVYIAYYESSGGGNMEARYAPGNAIAYASQTIINPTTPAGVFTSQVIVAGSLVNNVRVLATSSIVIGATLPGVTLGGLTMNAGTTLNVQGTGSGQDLEFTSVVLNGDATINGTGAPDVTLRNISETALANVTFAGNGSATLPTSNTYTGLTTISSGASVTASANNALGTAATGTLVQTGGSLRLAGNALYTSAEALTLNGTGNANSDAAMVNLSGNNDYSGVITLGSNSKIRAVAGNLRLLGQINGGANNLELRADSQMEITTGLSGSGVITKTGGNRTIIHASANAGTTFSGPLNVNEGVWDARANSGLGTAAAGTVIANNARLDIQGNITLADNISVTGTSGGNGGIRNESGSNVLSGNVTLTGGTQFFVNETQLTINNPIAGGQALTKSGAGTLILLQNNTLSNFDLAGGEVRISTVNGLGSATAVTVDSGEALEFDGSLNFNGASTLQSIVLAGGTLTSVSGTTTLDIPITLGFFSNLNVNGAGNLVLPQSIGNGNAPISANSLNHLGYRRDTGDAVFNLHNNGGALNGLNPTAHPTFTGQSLLSTPLSFPDENSFLASGVFNFNIAGYNDNYVNVWVGYLNSTEVGAWQFQRTLQDDWTGIWIDIDQDGVLESTVAGLGSDRGEQIAYNDGNVKNVNLTNPLGTGRYLVAFTHLEGSGGASAGFNFKRPSGASLAVINPGLAAQAGLWSPLVPTSPTNGVVKSGTGSLSLLGNNTFNGTTTVNGGTLVAGNNGALGLSTQGTVVADGATLAFSHATGIQISGEAISATGAGAAGQVGAITNLLGDNSYSGAITAAVVSAGNLGIGSVAGKLTLDGTINQQFSKLTFNGAGDVVVNSDISGNGVDSLSAGIQELIYKGFSFPTNNDDAQDDIEGIRNTPLGPQDAAGTLLGDIHYPSNTAVANRALSLGATSFPTNSGWTMVWVTSFTPDESGPWGLRYTNVDDFASIWIDTTGAAGVFELSDRIQSRGCCGASGDVFTPSLTAGQTYLVGIAARDFNSGNFQNMQFKSPTAAGITGGNWVNVNATNYPNTFRVLTIADNSVIKNGLGSVTLAGNNTYNGATTVNAGTLIAGHNNALGQTSAGTTVADGATLGLTRDTTNADITITGETLNINGVGAAGRPGVLVNMLGSNTIAASTPIVTPVLNLGQIGIGSVAGTLNIEAPLDLKSSKLIVDGAGNTVINGVISGTGVDVGGAAPENVGAVTGVFANVPEANDYVMVYEVANLTNGVNGAISFPYSRNNSATVQPFDRIAYYLELQTGAGALEYVYVSMDAFTNNLQQIGVPNGNSGPAATRFKWQRTVSNMNVYSNRPTSGAGAITPGVGLATGNIEIWPSNYGGGNDIGIPNAAAAFDFGDGGSNDTDGYGSFQIHNHDIDGAGAGTAGQVLLAYNNWRSGSGDLGIGNRTSGEPDYTFANNLPTYSIKRMAILVHETAPRIIQTDNSLIKNGTGTLTLGAPTGNTYIDATTVNGGTLLANNNTSGSGTGTGNVAVNNSATLGGTGSIAGAITLSNTAHLAPGASVESLSSGNVLWNNGTNFDVEFAGTGIGGGGNAANGHDILHVTGSVTLGNAVLNVLGTPAQTPNAATLQTFTIISNDGTDAITGTFLNLPEGSPVPFNGGSLYISYVGGDGNDVVLTSQPVLVGTAGDDTMILRRDAGNTQFEFSLNGAAFIGVGNPLAFNFNGQAGDDVLVVDYVNGDAVPGTGLAGEGVFFNGNGQTSSNPGDMLRILGSGTQAITYRPSATTNGDGNLTVASSGTITFTGLEPIDVIGAASFSVVTPNSNDVVAVTNGVTFVGALPAMVVSGVSAGIGFETVALRNVGAVTIDTGTNDGGSPNDAITINSADNAHGNGSLTISSGAGADTVTLLGNVAIDGNLTFTAVESIVVGATLTIDTEQGDNSAGGSVSVGTAMLSASGGFFDLTINTSAAGQIGGAVTLGVVSNNTTGSYLNDLTINTSGATAGLLTLGGNITLSGSAADTADFILTGNGKVAIAASITIDTEVVAAVNPGGVDWGTANIYSVGSNSLTINVNRGTGGTGIVSGNVLFGLVDNNAGLGNFLSGLFVNTEATGGTSGEVRLSGNVFVDGPISLARRVVAMQSMTIDSKQSATGPGNAINLGGTLYARGGNNRDVVIDTSTPAANQNGGALTFGDAGMGFNLGTSANILNDLTVDTSAGAGGTPGSITIAHANFNLNDNGTADPANLLFVGGGRIILNQSTTIDLEDGNNGRGGSVDFGTSPITGNAADRDLTISAGTSSAAAGHNAGDIVLAALNNTSGGSLLRNVSLSATTAGANPFGDITFTAASQITGTLTVNGNNIVTNAPASLVTGGNVSFTARNAVTLNHSLNAAAGTVTMLVNQDNIGAESFTQNAAAASITTANATATAVSITVGGTGNAALQTISAANGGVVITTGGAIVDSNGTTNNVIANTLTAATASGVDVDVNVTTVNSATVSGTGSIDIFDFAGGMVVTLATTNNGDVTLEARGGDLVLTSIAAGGVGNINAATTVTGNIAVGSIQTGATGDVVLTSIEAITDINATNPDIVTDDLTLLAVTGIGSSGDPLETSASNLEANGGNGGIFVANTGSLEIGGIGLGYGLSTSGVGIVVTTSGALTISENVIAINAGTDVTLSALDALTAGQNLTINAGAGVSSLSGSVLLNAGDNATIAGNVTSGTTTTINVDNGNADPAVGGALSITGVITTPVVGSGGGAFLNGQTDDDTFTFNPQTTTEFRLLGDLPVSTATGDTLVMNVAGTSNPSLTVPGSLAPYNGDGSGVWSFTSAHRPVLFGSIEESNITGNYHLTFDNGVNPVANLVVMLNPAMTHVQLRDGSTGGNIVYQGSLATILSLRVLGSAGNDRVTVDDINTLPNFTGTVPLVTDNGNLSGTAEFLFDGLGGSDTLVYNINGTAASQQYAIGNGSGAAGLEGEIESVAAGVTLVSYFQNVENTQRTGTGTAAGGLTVIGDASANVVSIQANGALTQTSVPGYTPFEFSGNNYATLTVNALAGADTIDLIGLGSGQTNNPAIFLNGNSENDTLRVRSTSLNTGVVTLNGNAGNDLFQLFDGANTVDGIAGQVVVDGTDGNVGGNTDTLVIVDSGDGSGDSVLVSPINAGASADYGVDGINNVGGVDVILRNIDVLDYTGTAGNDVIDGQFSNTTPPHDLSMVSLSGWLGADQFYLFTSDQVGGTNPTPTPAASGLASISLFGDALGNPNAGDGNDIFGATPTGLTGTGSNDVGLVVADTTRMIRPSASTSIAIDGGQPTGLAAPLGDVTGDVSNIDISALPNSTPVIVSTFAPGTVSAVGIQPLTWTQIEDMNLVDQGKLTNVQMGDLFARTTPNQDLVQLTRNPTTLNPNQVRLRITATIGNYSASNKTIIYGGALNDTITQSNLTIPAEFYGEDGDDVLSGAMNNDWLVGGLGNDRINGSGGDNVIWGDNSPTLPSDPQPQDLVIGGDDVLSGLGGADVFYGGGGNDLVSAGGGNDYAYGGEGDDTLDGHDGDDRLYGGNGNDVISGHTGNDLLSGGGGNDRLYGTAGNDVLIGGSGADLLDAGAGNDLLISGNVANQLSSWAGTATTSTFSAATYTNPADNDVALLTLLAQWGASSNNSGLAAMSHDGANDDLFGGTGDDDFCWENIDVLDNPPGASPSDFNAMGMGTDERIGPT